MKIKLELIDLPQADLRASVDEDALDELAASLRDHGQLQPIGVAATENGRFEVVYGARRTRAATLLKWTEIEAVEVHDDIHANRDAKKLIENVQRLDMTPMEEAYGLIALIGEGTANVRALQQQTGKSRDWVTSRLALIEMPEDLQGAVQAGVLAIGVARAFAEIESQEVREQYIKMAVENGCTVDQARGWASHAKFAEQGIITMDEYQKRQLDLNTPPQAIDQQYHCFICTKLESWRRVNALMICAACQDAIGESRLAS